MNLYNLSGQFATIMQLLEDADGELTPAIEDALNSLTGDISGKLERLCEIIETYHADEVGVQAVLDRLEKRKAICVNTQKRLKDYIKKSLEILGEKRYKAGTYSLTVCNNSQPTITWDHFAPPPEGFQRVTVEFDRKAAYNVWKSGIVLPEGITVHQGTHLRIS